MVLEADHEMMINMVPYVVRGNVVVLVVVVCMQAQSIVLTH